MSEFKSKPLKGEILPPAIQQSLAPTVPSPPRTFGELFWGVDHVKRSDDARQMSQNMVAMARDRVELMRLSNTSQELALEAGSIRAVYQVKMEDIELRRQQLNVVRHAEHEKYLESIELERELNRVSTVLATQQLRTQTEHSAALEDHYKHLRAGEPSPYADELEDE